MLRDVMLYLIECRTSGERSAIAHSFGTSITESSWADVLFPNSPERINRTFSLG